MPRLQDHHLHLPYFHADMNRTMKILYAMRFLRDVVNKLTVIFIPIYIFEQLGLVGVCLFFGICRAVSLIASIPVARLGTKIGHNLILVISHFVTALFLILLWASQHHPLLVFVAACFEGLSIAFFWPSYYTLLSRAAHTKRMGEDLGLLQFLLKLASLVSPAVGGSIAVVLGFDNLFLTGLVFVIASAIVVLMMKAEPEADVVSFRELFSWLKERAYESLAISYVGRYINDAVFALWPVYVFLLLGAVDSVGYLYTLSLFIAMIFSFATGIYTDRNRTKKPYFISGTILSVLWLLRSQVWSFWHVAFIDTVDKLTSNFHWLFYDVLFFKRSQGGQAYSYFVYREVIISIVAVVFWVAVAGLFATFARGWTGLFILAAMGVLVSLLVKDKHPHVST
jgi:MFS transporter, DHA1 family, staphyloferrin B biosynthesis exporter